MFSEGACRICLSADENLTSTSFKNEGETTLNDLLSYCVPEVDWNCAKLASLICSPCTEDLHISVKFRRKCLDSDKIRQEYIDSKFNSLKDLDDNESKSNIDIKAVRSFRKDKSKGKESYNCEFCQKRFSSSLSYKIHIGRKHKNKRKWNRTSQRNKDKLISKQTQQEQDQELSANDKVKEEDEANETIEDYKDNIEDRIAADIGEYDIQYNFDIDIKFKVDEESDKNLNQNVLDESSVDLDDNDYSDDTDENKPEVNSQNPTTPNTLNQKLFPGKKDKQCKVCHKEFTKTTTLMNHFRSVHSFENCFKCKFCDQGFPNKERLVRHENHHTGDRKYVCSICGKKFFTSSDLFHHNERHAGERKYKCDICNVKSFTTRNNLRTHKKIVHTNPDDWKFLCTHCGRKCVTQGALNAHMKRHGDRKDFPCSLCQKGFCTKAELEKHMRAHSDQREFKCEVCGQQYKLKEILERHLFRKHGIGDKVFPERVKKHPCPVCPLRFCSKLQLEKHLRSHNGERPFKCDFCDHSFICSSYLKGHLKNKHPAQLFKDRIDSNGRPEVFNDM